MKFDQIIWNKIKLFEIRSTYWNLVKSFKISSNYLKWNQLIRNLFKSFEIWSNHLKSCQIIWNHSKSFLSDKAKLYACKIYKTIYWLNKINILENKSYNSIYDQRKFPKWCQPYFQSNKIFLNVIIISHSLFIGFCPDLHIRLEWVGHICHGC